MQLERNILPAPSWTVTAWLSAPAQQLPPEVIARLRMSMFRRLEAVLVSAFVSLTAALFAVYRHPTLGFKIWLVLDVFFVFLRVPLAIHIMRRIKYNTGDGAFSPWATDLFIAAGTLWSASLGFGALLVMTTNDAGLVIIVTCVMCATLAAQCIRNPSSPRLNGVQMGIILVPFSAGAFFSPISVVPTCALLGIVYLVMMTKLTRQIHDDYVAMILAQMENRRRALHCTLTGLPNRGFFDDSLHAAMDDAARLKHGLSVLCIDLDGFKQVNDHFGHPMGDALLVQVADRLKHLTPDTDFVARLGGDEFVILMRSGDQFAAEALASRINRTMAEPFHLGPQANVTIGASVGIIVLDGDSRAELLNAGRIMEQADQALYKAKYAGKGTFRRYDDRNADPLRLAS